MPGPPLPPSFTEAPPFPPSGLLPAQFAVSLTFESERAVVAVRGELDLWTAPAFGAFLDAAAANAGCPVVIDFAGLTFIGASGLGQIARLLVGLRAEGRDLSVASPSPMTYRLLDLAGLTSVMSVDRRSPARSERTPGAPGGTAPTGDGAGEVVGEVLSAALRLVVDLAATSVGFADGASVTLAVGDRLATVAASNDVVAGMDADQYSLGEGPCVSAATVGDGFYIESIASDTRWPAFASLAYQRGINSVISTPLIIDGRPVGALNIYSRTPRAFAPPQGELAWRLATQAAMALEVHASDVTGARAVGGAALDRRTCTERRRIPADGGHGERRTALREGGARPEPGAPLEIHVGARSD